VGIAVSDVRAMVSSFFPKEREVNVRRAEKEEPKGLKKQKAPLICMVFPVLTCNWGGNHFSVFVIQNFFVGERSNAQERVSNNRERP